jgi:hypothetical protein
LNAFQEENIRQSEEANAKLLEIQQKLSELSESRGMELESQYATIRADQEELMRRLLSIKVQNTFYVQFTSSPNFDNRSGRRKSIPMSE